MLNVEYCYFEQVKHGLEIKMKFDSQEVKNKQQGLTSKKQKKTTKKRVKVVKYILLTLLAIICIVGFTGLGVLVGAAKSAPKISEVNVLPTMYPSVIVDDEGQEIIKLSMAGAKRSEATSEEIPENLKWAFVDIEDERFYQHSGIDPIGILRAIVDNFRGTREGASTITQQLIKNNVFDTGGRERSTGSLIKRKVQEWVLALNLEKEMSKDEILVTYLNTINLGGGNYGVKEAAKYYLNKDLSQLTISEMAVIAAITQNPSANNPANHPEKNQQRQQAVLNNMLKNGHISQAEYDEAIADDVYARISTASQSSANSSIYSYFVDALLDQVLEDLQKEAGYTYIQAYNGIFAGGWTIYSTQNSAAQKIVEDELNNEENYETVRISYSISWDLSVQKKDGSMKYYNQANITSYYQKELGNEKFRLNFDTTEEADEQVEEYKKVILEEGDEITYENISYTLQPQASFSLIDYTNGHVLAAVGGRGEKKLNLSLNRVTDTFRQPGSTFKIVAAFAPALDMGASTLASTFDDAPLRYSSSGKYIANWWGNEYRGLHTVRDGIRDSMNIVACKTLYNIGASNCIPYLKSFGYTKIDENEDANMATAIGGITNGISNLENCAAFGAIANKGVYIEPTFYTKIVSRDGKVIYEKKQDTHAVLEEETASLLTSAMRDVVRSGTGVSCNIQSAPLAGKTGTTNEYRDIWFVGYVPNGLCSCIWIGYDENGITISNASMQKAFYSKVMEQLVVALGREGGSFEMTGDIVQAAVCSKSGLLPNEFCAEDPAGDCIITEYFRAGTVPTEKCTTHEKVKICKESGKLANEYCPEDQIEEKVVRIRPNDVDGTEPKGETSDTPYEKPKDECDIHNKDTASSTETEPESTDTGLKSVRVDGVELIGPPYEITVSSKTTSVSIDAVPSDPNATIKGTGTKEISVGTNQFKLTVTAPNGSTRTYNVVVYRPEAQSSDASIKSVVINGTVISSPPYTISVPSGTTQAKIEVRTNNSKATVSGAGTKDLHAGTNTFTVTVTAEDGTTATYEITVVVPETPPDDGNSSGGSRTEAFDDPTKH